MLPAADICSVIPAQGRQLTLPSQVAAYGIASGQVYGPGPGAFSLNAQDRAGEVMLYWTELLVQMRTEFVGEVPTPANSFEIESHVALDVASASALHRFLLRDALSVSLSDFSLDVSEKVCRALHREAGKYRPEDMVGGVAQARVEASINEQLGRIYGPLGFAVRDFSLTHLQRMVEGEEAKYLIKRIRAEAEAKNMALEESLEEQRKVLNSRASQGDRAAKTAYVSLEDAEFAGKLHAADAAPSIDKDKPIASVQGRPVLLAEKGQENPRFVMLSANEHPAYFEMRRPWCLAGRDENCHVKLPGAGMSALHATVARIDGGLLLVDHASTYGTVFNGERIAQRFLQSGDVLRMGGYWMVFKIDPSQEVQAVRDDLLRSIGSSGQTIEPSDYAELARKTETPQTSLSAMVQLVSSIGHAPTSDSAPILIGSDPACDLRITGAGVARFHAIVYWNAAPAREDRTPDAGVFIEDLHSGRGLSVNRALVQRKKRLEQGDIIEVGGYRMKVVLAGNVEERARALAVVRPVPGRFALTCIEGPCAGASLLLDDSKTAWVIGKDRESGCDLVLGSEGISRRHVEIESMRTSRGEKQYCVRDLGSTNGTKVNGHQLQKDETQVLNPGDIVRLSKGEKHCDLLVHCVL